MKSFIIHYPFLLRNALVVDTAQVRLDKRFAQAMTFCVLKPFFQNLVPPRLLEYSEVIVSLEEPDIARHLHTVVQQIQ